MKIDKNLPVSGTTTAKTKKSGSTSGAFKSLFDAQISPTDAVDEVSHEPEQQGGDERAWRALEESLSLLDRAMEHLQSGKGPSDEMIHEIDSLRTQLKQQLTNSSDQNLKQADTLLAVEAERMRSMKS